MDRYHNYVSTVANAIRRLAGPRAALAMLVRFVLNEPKWCEYSHRSGWSQHAYQLAALRSEVKELGDLEAPLLQIVLRELRRELETRKDRNRAMYHRHYSHFWSKKSPEFLRTADTVFAQHKESSEYVEYIATYVAIGLDKHPRAIEMLQAAHEAQVLSANGQWLLAQYLHHEERFEDSIGLLEALIELRPSEISYRTHLMHAYFRTQRQRELLHCAGGGRQIFPRRRSLAGTHNISAGKQLPD